MVKITGWKDTEPEPIFEFTCRYGSKAFANYVTGLLLNFQKGIINKIVIERVEA